MNIVAHRGASVAEAENTPAAFAAADRLGADGVELDVRIAADGAGGMRLVVHHDPLPTRQDELDALPSFDDVLRACGDRMLVNVEIKNSESEGGFDPTMAVVAPTLAAMWRADDRPHRWLVSSFSEETVAHVRRVDPKVATALLTYPLDEGSITAARRAGHAAIHPYEPLVDAAGVEAAHAAGLMVNVWTVNDPDRIAALAALGVDGICTDVPDVARAALGLTGAPDPDPGWR